MIDVNIRAWMRYICHFKAWREWSISGIYPCNNFYHLCNILIAVFFLNYIKASTFLFYHLIYVLHHKTTLNFIFLVFSCIVFKPKLIVCCITYIVRVSWETIYGLIHDITCSIGALAKISLTNNKKLNPLSTKTKFKNPNLLFQH